MGARDVSRRFVYKNAAMLLMNPANLLLLNFEENNDE